MANEISPRLNYYSPEDLTASMDALRYEVNLLSGRVELTMRLLARIVAKMDPGFADDPRDPETKRRSDLLGQTILDKLCGEALSQNAGDPEQFHRLQRYFRNTP